MKTVIVILLVAVGSLKAQGLIGTWQLTDDKTCFQTEFQKSKAEKELEQSMGASKNAIAKLITFDEKGMGEEGIFSQGNKKGVGKSTFKYDVKNKELQLMDKKSGIITQRFIIDELTESTLVIHNAMKDCEIKTFSRIK